MLELKLVEQGPSPTKEALLQATGGQVPPHIEVLPGVDEPTGRQPPSTVYYLVRKVADRHRPRPAQRQAERSTSTTSRRSASR